jgi:hypothetical protein
MLDYRIHFAQLVAEDRLRERRQRADRPAKPEQRIFKLVAPAPSRRPSR